jgi:hypothetical protein
VSDFFARVAARRVLALKLLLLLYKREMNIEVEAGIRIDDAAAELGADVIELRDIAIDQCRKDRMGGTYDFLYWITQGGRQDVELALRYPEVQIDDFPPVDTIRTWINSYLYPGDPGTQSSDADPTGSVKKRGRPANASQHKSVAAKVEGIGADWKDPTNLKRLAEWMDAEKIPLDRRFLSDGIDSWAEKVDCEPEEFIKAIMYRLNAAKK